MNFKSAIAGLGLSAMSALGLASQSEAKTHVFIGVGVGSPYYGDCDYSLIFHDCYDPWPGYGFRYRHFHRRPMFYDDPPVYYRHRMSCDEAIWSLRDRGYRNVRARDCQGNYYSFRATRHGVPYRIRINALSGQASRERY